MYCCLSQLNDNVICYFAGGTNFGFLNGANTASDGTDNSGLQPTTTSYDYSSPISEFGNLTEKYFTIKKIIENHTAVKTKLPEVPDKILPVRYTDLKLKGQLSLNQLIENAELKFKSYNVKPMEKLPINNNAGQSYGYVVYRKTQVTVSANSILKISGYVRDTVLVLLNGRLISEVPKDVDELCNFGFWKLLDSSFKLPVATLTNATLDLVVENMGRVNYGKITSFVQFKGLTEDVHLNNRKLVDWEIIPLEFKSSWSKNLSGWTNQTCSSPPALYKFELNLFSEPADSFIDMRKWKKGITIVNGFVLGRHFFVGPQQSLFIPAPFLKKGINDIVVFEHYNATEVLEFSKTPLFQTPSYSTRDCI